MDEWNDTLGNGYLQVHRMADDNAKQRDKIRRERETDLVENHTWIG